MSKALVIKDADFSVNKLTTVELDNYVPCTGLSLSQDSITATAIGGTTTLTATKTPANASDDVVWSSSNENVATVADGVVTITGVGTCTITATCGGQTAVCAVASTVTYNMNTDYGHTDGGLYSSTDIASGKDYIGLYSQSRGRMYYSETNTLDGYKMCTTANEEWDGRYSIPVPANASKIKVTCPTSFTRRWIQLLDSQSRPTYSVSDKGCKALTNAIKVEDNTGVAEWDLTDYAALAYDSFSLCMQTANADASTISGDVIVEIS